MRWDAGKPRVLDVRQALRLYPVVDLSSYGGSVGEVLARIREAMAGGATMIQLREKGERMGELGWLYRRLRPYAEAHGVPVVINDRLDVALGLGAEGVHLGQTDMAAQRARELAGRAGRPNLIIGVSVTAVEEARRALDGGASYISVSPVFHTPTKPDAPRPAGLEGLQAIREALPDAAICAIGGVVPGNVPALLAAGADGVAFVSAASTRPEHAVRAMAAAVQRRRAALPTRVSAGELR